MKKVNYVLGLLLLSGVILFNSCKKDDETTEDTSSSLPTSFSIDIPDAISADVNTGSRSTNSDTLNGGQIYGHLRGFIRVGERSGQIVEDIITAISAHHINRAMDITYTSNEDNREKHLVVVKNINYESVSYEFKMTISDALTSEKGIQIFWNRSPIVGVAILQPYNINMTSNDHPNAIYRIDYDESGSMNYDKHMVVSIANRNVEDADIYGLDNLKMFVGKTADIIEVYGNSNHPNAEFFTNSEVGFDWAFVAASDRAQNIGVAEVGLPSNSLDSDSRTVILVDNAIKTVFNNQISSLGYAQVHINRYLYNTDAPGYFNNGGFVQGGASPSVNYLVLEGKINNLTPFNPIDIKNLTVEFE